MPRLEHTHRWRKRVPGRVTILGDDDATQPVLCHKVVTQNPNRRSGHRHGSLAGGTDQHTLERDRCLVPQNPERVAVPEEMPGDGPGWLHRIQSYPAKNLKVTSQIQRRRK